MMWLLVAVPVLLAFRSLQVTAAVVQESSLPPSQVVQCYVCGGGGSGDLFPGALFPSQPPPAPCLPEMLPALRACPIGYRGCLTTYKAGVMARSCERSVVDACQVANQVVYCYCSGGKCNTHALDYLQTKLASHSTHSPVDDEDPDDDRLEIGSGNFDDSEGAGEREVDGETRYGSEMDASERVSRPATTGTATERVGITSKDSDLFISSSSEEVAAVPAPSGPGGPGATGVTTPTTFSPSEASSPKHSIWAIATACSACLLMLPRV